MRLANQLSRIALIVVAIIILCGSASASDTLNYAGVWDTWKIGAAPGSQTLENLKNLQGTTANARCLLCHTTTSGDEDHLNQYGTAIFTVAGSNITQRIDNVKNKTSDSVTGNFSFLGEILRSTQPGWSKNDRPASIANIPLDPNSAPVLNFIGDQTVAEGSPLSFGISASDPDNDPLTFSTSTLPSGATFNSNTRQFSWTPGFDQFGSYLVTFTVSDGSLTDSETITIKVTNTNRAPTGSIDSPPTGTTLFRGVPVLFQGSGSDPDGDPVTFEWSFIGGTPSVPSATVQNPTVTFNTAGTVTVSLIVRDNSNAPSPKVTSNFTVMNPPPAGVLQFSAANFRVNESGGSAVITVTRTLGSAGAVAVTLQITGGTATAGSDYTVPAQMTVSFANGDTALKTVSIPIINDQMIEGDETVNLALNNPTNQAVLGTPNTAQLTIVDNPLISINDVILKEGQNAAVFTVTLSPASNQTVTVNYSTQDGTAIAGTDYIRQSNTLTFAAGQTTQTINVVLTSDNTAQPKYFFVNLSNSKNASILRAQGVGAIRSKAPMPPADFDGDGKAEIAVYRDGTWWISRSSDGGLTKIVWGGAPQDIPVPGDYDGDRKSDIAVYSEGTWWISRSSDGGLTKIVWGGAPQDIPVPGDYDGDRKSDIAVYSEGTWWISRSSDGGLTKIVWGGAPQDIPVPGDYDGDGKTDIAIYRDGTWWISRSSDGGLTKIVWGGAPQDIPVPGDYDGDRKSDIAVYSEGTWWISRSSDGGLTKIVWGGAPQDIPVPGDYDGDGKTDIAIYRDGTWWISRSSDGGLTKIVWGGAPQDIP